MYVKDWVARVGYITLALVMITAGIMHQNAFNTVSARLKTLEAAKTATQQPQERHYLQHLNRELPNDTLPLSFFKDTTYTLCAKEESWSDSCISIGHNRMVLHSVHFIVCK